MLLSVYGDVGADMKSYWDFRHYLKEETEEQTIEFDLDGKSDEDIKAFLDSQGIAYEYEDGYFYIDDAEDEEEDLQEASAKRKVVIRKGMKKIIFKCGAGKKKVGRNCIVRKSSELAKIKRRAKRTALKSKSKRSGAARKRKRSNKRRSTMGLNRRKR
jgi:hypothetical protein